VGEDQDAESVLFCCGFHSLADHAKGIDIKTGIELVEDGNLGLEQIELQRPISLLFATAEVDVERPFEELRAKDPFGPMMA